MHRNKSCGAAYVGIESVRDGRINPVFAKYALAYLVDRWKHKVMTENENSLTLQQILTLKLCCSGFSL